MQNFQAKVESFDQGDKEGRNIWRNKNM